MPVFDGSVKVGRAVADPKTDKNLPVSGSLSWLQIKSVTALAGTTGVDTASVIGDIWNQVTGNQTENYTGNVITTIFQNENLTVMMNRTDQVIGNYTETIIGNTAITMVGPLVEVNIGPRTETRVSPVTETDCSPKAQTETTAHFKVGPLTFETKGQKNGVYGMKVDIAGMATSLSGVKVDSGGATMKTFVLEMVAATNKVKIAGMEGKLNATFAKVVAMSALIGALKFGTPFKPNALPAPTPITPFD